MPKLDRQLAIESCYLVPGWCWPAELGAIYDILWKSTYHVEVGTFCGKSLFVSAMAVPDGAQLWAVDSSLHHPHAPSVNWIESVLEATISDARAKRPMVTIGWEKLDHLEAARRHRAAPVTSVYLDADHNYAETKAAIEAWWPLVRPGGVLLGHDFWTGNGAVIEAVEEFFGECRQPFIVLPKTRIWCAEKPIE